MRRIPNSGCSSQAMYNDLRARDRAKRAATWKYAVHCVKKNGELYKRPVANTGFVTFEDAEAHKVMWEKLNPGTKFAIVTL